MAVGPAQRDLEHQVQTVPYAPDVVETVLRDLAGKTYVRLAPMLLEGSLDPADHALH